MKSENSVVLDGTVDRFDVATGTGDVTTSIGLVTISRSRCRRIEKGRPGQSPNFTHMQFDRTPASEEKIKVIVDNRRMTDLSAAVWGFAEYWTESPAITTTCRPVDQPRQLRRRPDAMELLALGFDHPDLVAKAYKLATK